MKIKTSELKGAALDWAVLKANGERKDTLDYLLQDWLNDPGRKNLHCNNSPSENWSQGGPIIEREGIELTLPTWKAGTASYLGGQVICTGPTPLIAAMRCYVASKLGDVVEIPEELI